MKTYSTAKDVAIVSIIMNTSISVSVRATARSPFDETFIDIGFEAALNGVFM
ncbi:MULTISPECIES: hypothetical protein [unclassified Rhizobium]|uniref:hypothetical protein n=1 Tax=unclassified Rhizobium TaxID=2613769 RepID=UPI0017827814|nr:MULTISPECIES: hypothetical protein [unclassified Rhizobium]MBD8689005.1 hypothetical protein [Rhizobium sp. CFBP 13644]MBD8693473.1 hypothetical protein [Rhizobium sp. CFBP 13717]